MNGPNKTVANFRRKFGPNPAACAARNERMSAPSLTKDIMTAVFRGEMTAEEGANRVRQIIENEK